MSTRANFGRAGHLIVADYCRYHQHSHVGPRGKWCVSTVGAWHAKLRPESDGPHEIGYRRTYETMVFEHRAKDNDTELEMMPANSDEEADANHERMCRKWARIAKRPKRIT